jgi:alpha-tubulin suppressor-like RCC1 family protein
VEGTFPPGEDHAFRCSLTPILVEDPAPCFPLESQPGLCLPSGPRALGGVEAIAAGGNHSMALMAGGTVLAWGQNDWGQLGNGVVAPDRATPTQAAVQVSGLNGVTAIAAGTFHSMALKADGTVWTWGSNHWGQLNGPPPPCELCLSAVPVQAVALTGVTAIAAGDFHSVAVRP